MIFGLCSKGLIITAIILMVLSIISGVTSNLYLMKNVTGLKTSEMTVWKLSDFEWLTEKSYRKCKMYSIIAYVLFLIAFILILI